jgi:hypothetical protein
VLERPGRLPLQRWQLRVRDMLQIYPGVLFCFVLALFDIFNGFRRGNPALRVDVVDGRLRTLGILLGEEPQVFFADQDFGLQPSVAKLRQPKSCTSLGCDIRGCHA